MADGERSSTAEIRAREEVVARLHPHARALFLPVVALVLDAAAAGFLFGFFPEEWMNLTVLGGAVFLAILVFVLPLIAWLSRSYTITTRRIVLRSGFFVRNRQELLHSRGYDIAVRKAGLQILFGSGDVLVNTGLERPVMLRDVPGADLVQAALHDLMEASLNPIAARRQQEKNRPRSAQQGWDGTDEWTSTAGWGAD